MSATGILIIILGIFLLVNLDKMAWLMAGVYEFNTKNFGKSGSLIPHP